MGYLSGPLQTSTKPWRQDPWGRLVGAVVTVVMAVLLGIQYWTPNKRVVPVVAALLVFGVAWRLSMMAAVNLLVLVLPYPKGTVFGSTNLAFILLVFIIWLLRVSLRMSPPGRSTPADLTIGAMLLWGVLSFYNVRSAYALERAFINFELFLACVFLFYLIVNNVRTQKDLERLHQAWMITAFGVFLIAIWEARHPGRVLIPGLLDFSSTHGNDFNTRDLRVGASFRDYELLSEYCGIMFLTIGFQLARVRTQLGAWIIGALCLLCVYTMFTTVTRGVFVALAVALPYLFFMLRRRLNPVKFLTAVSAIFILAVTMNFLVAAYTNSGDLFQRLGTTKVVHGVVPEARQEAWGNAWERAFVHPILGQGPYYDELPGYKFWWPHNVYLFIANLYGFPGLAFYLIFLAILWRLLRPQTDDLRHESYADAYLVVARAQMIVFMLNELKIDYLRNAIYQFQVWQMFGIWTAAYLVSREHGIRARITRDASPVKPTVPRLAA